MTTDDLTDEETAFLRSDRTPAIIKQFVARQHDNIGVRAGAYRKVAAAARAERLALTEVRLLQLARAVEAISSEPNEGDVIRSLAEERDALRFELENQRQALLRMTAMPALATSSDD